MKTVISSTGNSLNSEFDLRFGRASWFCIYEDSTDEVQFVENSSKDAQSGAGTKAVEIVAELGAQRIISGDFGPKAKKLLEQFDIQMVILNDDRKTIHDIVRQLKS